MEEIWKDIDGYEGFYKVSNLGRVKSLSRPIDNGYNVRHTKERLANIRTSYHGYMLVTLNKDGKSKNFMVHRLVANAFIPNPKNHKEINHKDEN